MERYTVCLEKGLLGRLDEIVAERGYHSRSQAMGDFIRRAVTKKDWNSGRDCAAAVSVVHAAGSRAGLELAVLLRPASGRVMSSSSHPLPGGRLMTTVFLRGRPRELQKLADALRAVKGVSHGSFSIIAPL